MLLCFDCTRSSCQKFASDCRKNHKEHRTVKLEEFLRSRKERTAQLRALLEKHIATDEATMSEANKLAVTAAEENRQIRVLTDLIDQCAQKLHQEVDCLKVRATQFIEHRAHQLWEKRSVSVASYVQEAIDETLSNVRDVRTSLEHEIQRAEADELTRSIEMDALGEELAALLQSRPQRIPDAAAFELTALRTQLQASIEQLERDVSRSSEALMRSLAFEPRVPFADADRVRLVEQQAFHMQELVLPSDRKPTLNINNATYEEETGIMYFTDEFNPSSIKALNLKTRQLAAVCTCLLDSYSTTTVVQYYYLYLYCSQCSVHTPHHYTVQYIITDSTSTVHVAKNVDIRTG